MKQNLPQVSRPLYLLTGKELFLKREFVQALRRRVFPNDADAKINFEAFHGNQDSFGGFLEFIRTAPFLGAKRLAVLWEIDALEEKEKDSLLSHLKNLPATAVVVLSADESNARKNDFLKQLSSLAETVACHPPFEKDLPAWVEARARQRGIQIKKEAVVVLIERAGKDVATLSSALESLALYVHPGTLVTSECAEAFLGRAVQADIFDMVDVLLEKDLRKTVEITKALSRDGVRAHEMVAVLAGQLERLKKAAGLLEQGLSPMTIAAELKVHPFFSEKFMRQARRAPKKEIQRILNLLLVCDEAIKRGALSEEQALDRFVLMGRLVSRFSAS